MRKIESVTELSDIIKRYFVRGVATNAFMSSAVLADEIKRGDLYVTECGGNLYMLRKRTDHTKLNFYITETESGITDIPSCTVTEIPYRTRDIGLKNASTYLQSHGFELLFRRQRMSVSAEQSFCSS